MSAGGDQVVNPLRYLVVRGSDENRLLKRSPRKQVGKQIRHLAGIGQRRTTELRRGDDVPEGLSDRGEPFC